MTKREEEEEEPRCFESKVGALFKRKEERHRECVRFIFATRFAVEMKNPERRGMRIRRRSGGGFFGFFSHIRARGGTIPEKARFTIPVFWGGGIVPLG